MCIRNLNTDVTFFSKKSDLSEILEICNGHPDVIARPKGDNVLIIDTLCFMLSVNAIERKESLEGDTVVPSEKIVFNTRYEICVRLSETTSGKFVDLVSQSFLPSDDQTVLCRKVYTTKEMFQYKNILVARPPAGKNLCVLKVLVRPCGDREWTVQSMHPIRITEETG